ncbi:MAG: hypothetical protein CO136_02485 [Candidatus Levybacteria bacterium CG_4_9_14_3_um_filter_36_7]|nr:MAG: hypothetical protein AUK12_00430 [Candidatus Levybacteria bacterium CG2_30_37_29]PJA90350.1 MAG: hypothetical protein CO136_02485 [Candidatus Levybacteria bacterium CG_4_9_14_3_um_filter_36_7]
MYFLYILRSIKNGMFYIGSTNNLERRIAEHNSNRSRYTKNKGPFELSYKEEYNTNSEAKKREYYLKSLKSKKVIEKLINGPIV